MRIPRLIPPKKNGKKRKNPIFTCLGCLAWLLALVSVVFGGASGAYVYYFANVAPADSVMISPPPSSTKILDRNGVQLYEVLDPTGGRRTVVPLSKISPYLKQATIATEDADFYENPGISLRGLLRAIFANVMAGETVEGGSGITQQLVKNVLIPVDERTERSLGRKLKEAVLAFEITRRYSKDQILEWYLNEVNYGNLSYGIEAASKSYFGKSASDLNLNEATLLAGLPQAPARYSPFLDFEAAKARQSDVLDLMARRGYIGKEEAESVKSQDLKFQPPIHSIKAPHFVNYVREVLEARYGRRLIERGGLVVQTSLDLNLQIKAEKAVADGIKKLSSIDAGNAALVSMNPSNGEVLAMVGSADYWDDNIRGQFNVAASSRQPGSTFKPISYVQAFMKGYTPATVLQDVPTAYPDGVNGNFIPVNADNTYHGAVRIREALAMSLNPPAIKALQFAGLDTVIDLAHKLGITDLRDRSRLGLSLTLGGGEVKLLDLTYVYSVFANGGVQAGSSVPPYLQTNGMRHLDPTVVLKVSDPWGNVLEEHLTARTERILPAPETYLITDILSDNNARAPVFGYTSPLQLVGRTAAVKTGTTNDYKDFWAMGYTPQLVTGVWVGNTNNKPMKKSFSSTTAAPIWSDFMNEALKGKPAIDFVPPDNIERASQCGSGKKPLEPYVKGRVPVGYCTAIPAQLSVPPATAATSPANSPTRPAAITPSPVKTTAPANAATATPTPKR